MTEIIEHIVDFEWCNTCVHKDKAENEDPCWDCLTQSVNQNSRRPVSYKEDSSKIGS